LSAARQTNIWCPANERNVYTKIMNLFDVCNDTCICSTKLFRIFAEFISLSNCL